MSKAERAAAVLATLGYYGEQLTTPAIFEVTFKGKFSKEPAIIEMFDVIRNGICFDMGLLYMRELDSINDKPTNAIATNTDWLGVKMDAFARKALNNLIKNFFNSSNGFFCCFEHIVITLVGIPVKIINAKLETIMES